jgi:hypothetical protein
MSPETVGVAIAAAAATASWISAYISRQSVDRANRAFVWPAISHRLDNDGRHLLLVRFQNDGAGTAYNVRWSVGTVMDNRRGKTVNDHLWTAEHVSLVVRAVRPGEAVPPEPDWLEHAITLPPDDVWWLLVRWSDSAQVSWERADQGPGLLESEPRRLRTWFWQIWRPKRDW